MIAGLTYRGDGSIWNEEDAVAGDNFKDSESCDDHEYNKELHDV